MLLQLIIDDFVIVDHLVVDFQSGMVAITGETGAGKSIAIDALGLCLGNRAEISVIRNQAERAEINANFSLHDAPTALQWLQENDLDDHDECILRRVITKDGRSKSYINGTAVPLSQLKILGQLLVQIHGQNMHQQLLKAEHQRQLLDDYIHDQPIMASMKNHYQQWQQANKQLKILQQQHADRQAQEQLLHYQLAELDEFAPISDEYEAMDAEYKRLANSDQIIQLTQQVCSILSDNEECNALSLLHRVKNQIDELVLLDANLAPYLSMLEDAVISVNELSSELRHYGEHVDTDPQQLHIIEQRLSKQLSLARKHHVQPEALPNHYQQLQEEHRALIQQSEDLSELTIKVEQAHQQALKVAENLHHKRVEYGKHLAQEIQQRICELAMPNAEFAIEAQFDTSYLSVQGADQIEYYVKTNNGQSLQPLAKVVSGGELSRIALAIQVITAQQTETSTLIFDEVDTGISGATAAKVGQQLRQLSQFSQVICVTHLPQVAGNAHHHFFVTKESNAHETTTNMLLLDDSERVQELARLLGGDKITQHTLANAKELIVP